MGMTTERMIQTWTAPNRDITIQLWHLGTLVQVREINALGGPDATQIQPYAFEQDARDAAAQAASVIHFNQTGRWPARNPR